MFMVKVELFDDILVNGSHSKLTGCQCPNLEIKQIMSVLENLSLFFKSH